MSSCATSFKEQRPETSRPSRITSRTTGDDHRQDRRARPATGPPEQIRGMPNGQVSPGLSLGRNINATRGPHRSGIVSYRPTKDRNRSYASGLSASSTRALWERADSISSSSDLLVTDKIILSHRVVRGSPMARLKLNPSS